MAQGLGNFSNDAYDAARKRMTGRPIRRDTNISKPVVFPFIRSVSPESHSVQYLQDLKVQFTRLIRYPRDRTAAGWSSA